MSPIPEGPREGWRLCPDCDGDGFALEGYHADRVVPCPRCDGSGSVPDAPPRPIQPGELWLPKVEGFPVRVRAVWAGDDRTAGAVTFTSLGSPGVVDSLSPRSFRRCYKRPAPTDLDRWRDRVAIDEEP